MKSRTDPDRIIRSWLELGVTVLPDRVLDRVLEQLPATPQRRPAWRAWRSRRMISTPRLAMSAAAVVVAGLIGINLLSGTAPPDPGAPPSPTPVTSPRLDASLSVDSLSVPFGRMEAGRYHIDIELPAAATFSADDDQPGTAVRVSFEVPDGWSGAGWMITKAVGTPREVALAPFTIERVYMDPCHALGAETRGDASHPLLAATIDGLAGAFAAAWGESTRFASTSPLASEPEVSSLAGFDARSLSVAQPDGLDVTTCDQGKYYLWLEPGGERRYSSPGEFNRLWVVNVPTGTGRGGVLVIDAASFTDASPNDVAELHAIVGSIQIQLLDD